MVLRRILTGVVVALVSGGCATSMPGPGADTAPPGGSTTLGTSSEGPPGNPTALDPNPGGPPGLPGKTDATGANGAPFKIPPIILRQGDAIVSVERTVRDDIAAQCSDCVSVVVRAGTNTLLSRCQYSDFGGAELDQSDPEATSPSLILKPDTTLILFTGTLEPTQLPCDEIEEHFRPASTTSPEVSPEPSIEPSPELSIEPSPEPLIESSTDENTPPADPSTEPGGTPPS
jgi:hypothetical protein